MRTFGNRLKDLRIQRKLSQESLASLLKVSRSCIGNYEQNTREPSFEDLEKIADFFNVDIDYLVGRKDTTTLILSSKEEMIIRAYRADSITREMIDRIVFTYTNNEKNLRSSREA